MKLGWLSPDGKLYECRYSEHISMAYELVNKFNIDRDIFYKKGIDIEDDMLLASGWIKIGRDSIHHCYYIGFPDNFDPDIIKMLAHRKAIITQDQKTFLKHLYDDDPNLFDDMMTHWFQKLDII